MNDTNPPPNSTPNQNTSEKIHERPEVKPLVEKARAEPDQRVPQGTMKTGGDVPGGGGTKSLELPDDATQSPTPAVPNTDPD